MTRRVAWSRVVSCGVVHGCYASCDMPRPLTDPAQVARVVAAVRAGLSHRAAAAQFNVSPPTVARWVEAAGAESPPIPRAPSAAPPPAPSVDAPLPTGDALEQIRAIMARVYRSIERAEGVGNMAAVTTAIGHLSRLTPVLARLERGREEDRDSVRYSKEEIADAQASARAKLEAYLNRPLMCASCSRKLSAEWGGIANLAEAGADDHSKKPRKTPTP